MDAVDLDIRNATYGLFVDLGRAPSPSEVADTAGVDEPAVADAWRRLHDAHALVLDDSRTAIRMVNPFSAVPTPYRVQADGRSWYANCAWDAFGICGALHIDGRIETSCPDCGEAIEVDVRDQQPPDETLLFHCLVPAREWWHDIGFT